MKYRVVFSGGGTGGHYYPALSLINEFKKIVDLDLTYFTIYNRLDYYKVPEDLPEANMIPLKVYGLKRPLYSLKNIYVLSNTFINYLKVKRYLKRIRPHFVVLTGGYVTVPVGMAAKDLNIPIFLLEQNSIMGIANKVLSKYASKIFLSYEKTIGNKYPEKSIYSGNPIRIPENVDRKRLLENLGFNPEEKFGVVFGGSLGSEFIDNMMIKVYNEIKDINFLHVSKNIKEKFSNVRIFEYVDKLHEYLAISDFVICRGGATSLSEIDFFELSAIIIPWGQSAENQQYLNAKNLENLKNDIHVFKEDEVELDKIKNIIRLFKKRNDYTINKENPGSIIAKKILNEIQ
ncbi:hypothetical protein XO10_05685 [Marinitoga sp. 1135]|uniref:UDP-N-acetylglucosamine:LPS N-acetylglucosamine transferase n=1 Tax=Marinitoga piezophila (strain DSM 14283 / JCM 11233 / KA3) TaxID=443254 RepID=H2J855_MARPK|nr:MULTISPECIES: UDP-N-acetylglucosamine--N-acetylmuramyl-(pentapeptide) pyrophosphoryl-undecaprenol N-acetylglucosamine transferase [Marinitoga]AEX85546.1 UDP-N-acetylglucosamine:LPS N-acetylglucosamine transferase [Marinitoga piezophila KA3]APT76019.1 hypothetical protein LN42_06220 [Marinitoga sp. 1137]NUU95761.1 hypothetical protein [Marinitoga sp. 1135]NUU97683.1 hypothetical protein [Marinitoga sp. 1138]